MDLEIKIVEIRGHCPVYREEDSFTLTDGYILNPKLSCRVCMHSLASIMPYYNAIGHGIDPSVLGLAPGPEQPARVHCLDPCEYTGGGTVVFEIKRILNNEIERID